ncbi:MAG: HlyD family secretion protein [Planctomycetota bacterium]
MRYSRSPSTRRSDHGRPPSTADVRRALAGSGRRATLALLALVAALAPACEHPAKAAAQADEHEPDAAKRSDAPALGTHGQPLLRLEPEVVARLDLGRERAAACSHRPRLRALARVLDDPARRTVVRAPIAGRWLAAADGASLALGASLAAGAELGRVEPRLGAVERADAAAKLAQARADAAAARAELDAATRALDRLVELNARDKNASDKAVEDARARKDAAAARLVGAEDSAHTFEALLAPNANASAALPLRLASAGEVVELLARPGEDVDAGAALFAVADFATLRVRVDVPPSAASMVAPTELALGSPFDPTARWNARVTGLDADSTRSNGVAGWIATFQPGASAAPRPGAVLDAWIPFGAERSGFRVPEAAVVRLGGRAWVYVDEGDGAFERVELALDEPVEAEHGGGWFTTDAWAGERELVVRGAQALLSTEVLGAQTAAGAAEEE